MSHEDATSLLDQTPQQLADLVESTDPIHSLSQRLLAGSILAHIGDPRIGSVPTLCEVAGQKATIGVDSSDVDAVLRRWSQVGVSRDWIEKEVPAHTIELETFWVSRYMVTNLEFLSFLQATGYPVRPSTWYLGAFPADRSNHPVAGVDYESTQAYLEWRSDRDTHQWRLPTEAEWEFAASGPDRLEFPWGSDFDPTKANTRETGLHGSTPVGIFGAGRAPCGALDMAGNVEEFTSDIYDAYPGGRTVDDDISVAVKSYRVTRGGSFTRFGDLARTRRRHGPHPGPLYPIGFRMASDTPVL